MQKRFLKSLITSTLIGVTLLNVHSVQADDFDSKIEEAQQEAFKNEQAANDMNALINQLTSKVTSTQEAINVINYQMEQNETAIEIAYGNLELATEELNILHREIAVLEENIANRSEKLNHQARVVQVNGNPTTYFEFVLNSESVSEVIGRLEVVSNLVRSSNRMMEEQVRDQKAVEEKSIETEKKVAQQNALTQELVNKSAELQAQRMTQTALVAQLELERNTASENHEELIAKRNEALQLVVDIQEEREAVRLAAEQAAREQAAREAEERRALELAQAKAAKEAEAARIAQAAQLREAERVAQKEKEAAVSPATSSESSTGNNNENNAPNKPTPPEPKPIPPANEGWLRPASGYVSSPFGVRADPISGQGGIFHTGMDIAGSGAIRATRSGVVTAASYNSISGYYVVIDHGAGMSSLYAHMTPGLTVHAGQRVSQGQQIGTMGTTGYSTGVHLHFEIISSGQRVNPALYVGH